MNKAFRAKLFSGSSDNSCRLDIKEHFIYENCKIGKGTYGSVYKATSTNPNNPNFYALKLIEATGLSVSACREISILRELSHPNIIKLERVFLNYLEKKVWLVLEYAEFDLWHIIKYQKEALKEKRMLNLPPAFVKSIMHQLCSGIDYMHKNWSMHRDLKPANILVMGKGSQMGTVKITDMGFARIFYNPLKPLADIDNVVVTLWYRAPELLLGARHYTTAIDNWAIGCIFSELLTLEPIFHCRQEDAKSITPFNADQLDKIFTVLGFPNEKEWPTLKYMPEYNNLLQKFNKIKYNSCNLLKYYEKFCKVSYNQALKLLSKLLIYDPVNRYTASQCLTNQWFKDAPLPSSNIFESDHEVFQQRAFMKDDNGNYGATANNHQLNARRNQAHSNVLENNKIAKYE